jgi:hypothetical protein
MKEISLNSVIWAAIKSLKNLFESYDYKLSSVDKAFRACKKELCALDASEKEIELRLFALALYCYKAYGLEFSKTATFSHFAKTLDYFHFQHTVKTLIRENNYALVVFWVVFRLSFMGSIPHSGYLQLEKEMRNKSLELGTSFVY